MKVLIIGAGPAGLTAGLELRRRMPKVQVTILEADSQVGGISKTINHNGNHMDLGGHRFFTKVPEIEELWEEIMGEDFLIRERNSHIFYNKKFFDYPVTLNKQTLMNMGFLNSLKAGFGYLGSLIHKLPETSLENFYVNKFGRPLYSMFFEGYTEKLWGRHPTEISAEWGAQRVKGVSIKTVLKNALQKSLGLKSKETETSLIEEFKYPKYGPGQMWDTFAGCFKTLGGTLKLNHEVVKIDRPKRKVIAKTPDGEVEFDYDILISSMPIRDLCTALGDIPEHLSDIAQGLPYRDFVTLGVLVDKLNYETKDNWIYVQDPGVKMGRIQIFNNWSPEMVASDGVWLGLEYFCAEGDDFWNLSEDQLLNFAKDELIKIGIISKETEIKDYHREEVKKAYPAYFDTYSELDKLIKYLDDNAIICIGRNGQHRYNNMDHSMLTAIRAVDFIQGKCKREDIWNVNTEKEYHEENKINEKKRD